MQHSYYQTGRKTRNKAAHLLRNCMYHINCIDVFSPGHSDDEYIKKTIHQQFEQFKQPYEIKNIDYIEYDVPNQKKPGTTLHIKQLRVTMLIKRFTSVMAGLTIEISGDLAYSNVFIEWHG